MQYVGRMGAWVALALSIGTAGALGVWPDSGRVLIAVGIAILVITLLWWVPCNWAHVRGWIKRVEPSHLIWSGTIGALFCMALTMGGLLWQKYKLPLRAGASHAQEQKILTASIGVPPLPHAETVQWNQIFGTTRAADVIYALFIDGVGPESRSVQLREAFLESGVTGEVIKMRVAGSDNPLANTFPVSETNPLPPSGFIRLVAELNQSAPQDGLSNREFLERWRKIWLNVTYEDGKVDRILFDEKLMESYFPGLAGPRITRRLIGK